MVEWLKIADRKKRETAPVTPQIDAEISHFCFHHYANWFSKDDVAQAFATIPQVMTWDDHDIMDGYGSYPDELQSCAVFQHAYRLCRRFYLAFQQHTSLDLAHSQANLFGVGQTYSMVRLMGKGVALVAPDVRAERTRKQVVSPESWKLIFDKVAALPPSVRHIVVMATIPVVYPKIPLSEKAMGMMSSVGRVAAIDTILQKTGLWGSVKGKVVSQFEEPQLLDDLLDHWTSDFHTKEREMLIKHLQTVAQGRHSRISFISGDVHVAGLGRLYSYPKMDLRKDFRFMPQVVSSAIMNAPPPMGVVGILHKCSNAHVSGIDKNTKEKMVRIFIKDYPNTPKLLPKRNWATLRELPPNQAPPPLAMDPKDPPLQAGDLLVVLRVEADHKQFQQPVKQYPIGIPTLEPIGGAYGVTVPANMPHPGIAPQAYAPNASASYYSPPQQATGGMQYAAPAAEQYQAPYIPSQQYQAPYDAGQTQQYAGNTSQYSPQGQGSYGNTQSNTGAAYPQAGAYNALYAQPSGDVYQQFGNMTLGATQGAASYPQNTQGGYPANNQNYQGAPQQPT